MTVHEYYDYMQALAERHILINQNVSNKHFFRGELEEFYTDLRNKVEFPALIAESFELTYSSDEKTRETSFIIANRYGESKNWDNIYASMELCERIGDEVLRRMIFDTDNGSLCANIEPVTATPLLDEQHLYVGIRYTIHIESDFDFYVDKEQWTDLMN